MDNSTNDNTPIGKIIALLAILIIVIVVVFAVLNHDNKDDDSDKDNRDTETSMVVDKDENDEDEVVENTIFGTYSGQARVLTSALVFNEADLTYQEDGSFSLAADGLDLAILNNPLLLVGEQYPVVRVTISGLMDLNPDSTADVSATSIDVNFVVSSEEGAETILDDATSLQLLEGLSALGVVVPEASEEAPVNLTLDLVLDVNTGSLTLQSQSDAEIFVNFEGVK